MDQRIPNKERISFWMGACMVAVAFFVDVLQFILTLVGAGVVVDTFISVGASFGFWFWFNLLGVSFIRNPKRLSIFSAGSIGELVPVVNALPMWALSVFLTVKNIREEDRKIEMENMIE